MHRYPRLITALVVLASAVSAGADSGTSTRVVDPNQYARPVDGRYPYREKSEYILQELDLRPGDVVVDIGAGDGWWARKMAEAVGPAGVIHAAEVDKRKVDSMSKQLAGMPQLKPYLCPTNGTGLPENSCDLAFLSKTYHHLSDQVDYLRHLRKVVKPTGRVCIIERYARNAGDGGREHAWCPGLLTQQAHEAGWILVRCEMITGTYHYIAIFVSKDLFSTSARDER